MATFSIEISDEKHTAGITAARLAYNLALTETILDEGGNAIPNPELILTDSDYVQFVMSRAAESYSKQYNT